VNFVGTNSFDDTDRPLLLPKEETVLSSSFIGGSEPEERLAACIGGVFIPVVVI
jgi:hypothetical protein